MRLIMNEYIEQIYWIFWVDKLNKDLEKDLEGVLEKIFSSWTYSYKTENAKAIKQILIEINERTDDGIIQDLSNDIYNLITLE